MSRTKRHMKTSICKLWLKARNGKRRPPDGAPRWWGCPNGQFCRFAHGEEELKPDECTALYKPENALETASMHRIQQANSSMEEIRQSMASAVEAGLSKAVPVTINTIKGAYKGVGDINITTGDADGSICLAGELGWIHW